MSIINRMFDFYKLRRGIKIELSCFLFAGVVSSLFVIGEVGYKIQVALGIQPGTPITEIENGLLITILMLIGTVLLIICGLFIGALIHALFLGITGRVNIKVALGATILNKYPNNWFK
jgi:hypothetical protein